MFREDGLILRSIRFREESHHGPRVHIGELTQYERKQLRKLISAGAAPARMLDRARMLLRPMWVAGEKSSRGAPIVEALREHRRYHKTRR